ITFHSFARWFIPHRGVSELEKAIINISGAIEEMGNATNYAIQGEEDQLSSVVVQNRMALDMVAASHGGVCTVVNSSCCVYVSQEGKIEKDLK
ncbi:ERVV2 protein, partial [Crotophaga sulcirostris]|nr:ERVV2 protein [Crotophaga sulcirostris]